MKHFDKALYEFEAVGHHRFAAAVENNHGYLLLTLGRFAEAETRLNRARSLFDGFADKVRRAQVDETLAQLYIGNERLSAAQEAIMLAVDTLEAGGEEALLAEALTTQGIVFARLTRSVEARRALVSAYRVAERCGDSEGAGRAILAIVEELFEQIGPDEQFKMRNLLSHLLANTQQASIRNRLGKCLELLASLGD